MQALLSFAKRRYIRDKFGHSTCCFFMYPMIKVFVILTFSELKQCLLTVEACEAEHADLLCDVVPGACCPQSLELSFQLSPHQQDPVGHGLHIVLPTLKQM